MRILFFLILSFALIFICYAGAEEEGLVLHFRFDGLDGDQLLDRSGMGNHGTAMGQYKIVDGKFGKGLQMDGSQANYVEVFDSDSLHVTEVYTMAVWVKFAEITGQRHQFFFDKGADDKTPGGWRLGKVMSGNLRFQIYKDGAWQAPDDVGAPDFVADEWYHCAVTRDESGVTKICLNGKPEVVVNNPSYILPVNENSLILWGSNLWGTNNMFTGVLDEMVIFNGRALSQGEIQHFMESGSFAVEADDKLVITWGYIKH
ncbi:hypothetical protein GF312_14550 [Candidatus Poribacteria bacterium]|nr:hypothetical protein [Candidatus Poribacteria bacterium]